MIGEIANSMRAAPEGTKLFAAVPDLSVKEVPPLLDTHGLFAPKDATTTCPSSEICNAVQAPLETVTVVKLASPTFHFLKPEFVANQT